MFKQLFKKQAEAPDQAESQPGLTEPPWNRMETVKAASAAFAPGTEIKYHPDLIQRFQGHHASLQKIFTTIKTHATNDAFADAGKSLQSFRLALTAHLLEENVKLYTYLSKCLAHDPDSKELVLGMKAEMGQIGTAVMRFVTGYADSGITAFNKDQFLVELDEVGATLVHRIEREESSLYTMYMPPEAFGREAPDREAASGEPAPSPEEAAQGEAA